MRGPQSKEDDQNHGCIAVVFDLDPSLRLPGDIKLIKLFLPKTKSYDYVDTYVVTLEHMIYILQPELVQF